MPRSKKPRVKRTGANPAPKPGFHQTLNKQPGQHGPKPAKAGGKKSKNTFA